MKPLVVAAIVFGFIATAALTVAVAVALTDRDRTPTLCMEDYGTCTAIVLSYNRPGNIPRIVDALKRNRGIKEVIVAHGDPATFVEFGGVTNVKDFRNNDAYGGARRFLLMDHVTTEFVFFLDDDIVPSEALMVRMHNGVKADPVSIYDPTHRQCNRKGYRSKLFARSYDTVLTNCAYTSVKLVREYPTHPAGFPRFETWLRDNKGNCEDLSLNLFLRKRFGKRPRRVKGPFKNLDNSGGYSSKPSHYRDRSTFCKMYS